MEIKSSLINSKSFKLVKNSLIKISEIDNEQDFRVDMLEYINDSADNNDDEFFYDMLEFVRFLNPKVDDVAYTDKNHLIWMNAPAGGEIGKKVRQWDFVYDHECLHQLWDTFGVGDRLKADGIKYNHMLLNIASDCVINDYLSFYRKKESPKDLVTPEYLKEKYDVEYNRKKDTQYTLYLKLLEKEKELEKNKEELEKMMGESKEQQGEQSQSNSDNKEGKGNNKEGKENNKEGKDKEDNKGGNKGEKENKEGKDKEDNKEGKGNKGNQKDEDGEPGKGWNGDEKLSKGEDNEGDLEDVDLDQIKKDAEEVINKYKEKLSGDLGKFISQCQASQKLKESGLVVGARKSSSWNAKLQQYTNAFIKNIVFKKHREFKRTYQRVKRGSGFVEYGQPIQRGKKLKDDKLLINSAFYVDISGSMYGWIDDVFKSVYIIANTLQKQFGKEKVIDKISFDMFVFNERIKKIDWGKKVNANGGNVGFDQIVKYIKDETNDYMINVVVTDAEFDINEDNTKKFIKDLNGIMIFISNNETTSMKHLAEDHDIKHKLFYIKASDNFEID